MLSPAFLSQKARWNAVKQRTASADGVFVYAVRTTKIYCRPVCKARLARQANVLFFDTAAEAERAQYRPCKRCKPDLAGPMPEGKAAQRVRAMVERDLPLAGAGVEGPIPLPALGGLAQMARQAGLSKWHFHRVFKEVTSLTPTEYVRQQAGDSTTDLTSSFDRQSSKSLSFGVLGDMTARPELGSATVASTETQLDLSLAIPLPTSCLENQPIEWVLDDLSFDFADFLADPDDNLFEKLSRIPDEYEHPGTLTGLQDRPTGDVKLSSWDMGWDTNLCLDIGGNTWPISRVP
ncbi:hypothetical protein BR93DRAFT_922992 [Coniochaeta sp. PMI_546]|nr:hypothetical protein BR93DRAFT_922992 [Coniochaeta sp. PMI_546]